MKKILLFSNLAWMLVVILIIASAGKSKPTLAIASNTPPNCNPSYLNGMNAETLLKGIARYRKYHFETINTKFSGGGIMSGGFSDARSCWYSLDELNKFICLIEKNAPSTATPDKLGIRFYYATYPDPEKQTAQFHFSIGPADVAMHHTLFMVPTILNNETNFNDDLMIPVYLGEKKEASNKEKTALLHAQWRSFLTQPNMLFLSLGIPATTPSSVNQGGLCPPNCPSNNAQDLADAAYPDAVITKSK